jgi:DNA-binding transcriptional MerR regulator
MNPKLYKAADVCEMVQLQPYVLRSWEKEFPGIGVQKSPDSPRLYRDADVEQVQRIKQLVFGEGLTLAGARRRLEQSHPHVPSPPPAAVVERSVQPPRAAQPPRAGNGKVAARASQVDESVRSRIAHVRAGLQSILDLLSGSGSVAAMSAMAEEYQLKAPATASLSAKAAPARVRKLAARRAPTKKAPVVAKRGAAAKRKRASA